MAKRILCIDDEPMMLQSIKLTLETFGYEVHEAEDGRKGVDLATTVLPDLIICDIQMPGMDGFQALTELRKNPQTSAIPFIFLTGEDPRTQLRKGMNLGANDFILKPFEVQDFIKAVELRFYEADKNKKETQRAVDELSASITLALPHELKTPMTGVLGLAELFMTQANEMDPAEIKDLAQSLYESAVRMHETLEKFWIHTQCLLLPHDQEKLSASKRSGSKNADSIIKRIANELGEAYSRTNDLLLHLTPLSLAISDRYLEQVLKQLIENACKFSIKGTTITITTKRKDSSGIITIQDTGRGMSQDQIQKFHAFMQFDRGRNEQQGLGLGLVIARRLIEIHGGVFQIVSEVGKGTAISLVLPLL